MLYTNNKIKKSKCIIIALAMILVFLITTWLIASKNTLIKNGIYCTDPDSLFYYRIIDQAYQKGSEKYIDYDNYGNYPYLFKIGYPRFYFWTVLFVKKICTMLSPTNEDFLINLFPVITTTITALIIFISLYYLNYPPVFLIFTAFLLIPTFPAFNVGSFGKLDYDHILSLYIWGWLLSSMFYQDTERKEWLYLGGLFAGLLFGSWIGSLLLFFVVSVVCFVLWLFKSCICTKYLSYCYISIGIAALINTIVVLLSPTRYGYRLLDFGIIHILAIWLAAIGIYTLTRINPTRYNKLIMLFCLTLIVIIFTYININNSKDLIEKIFVLLIFLKYSLIFNLLKKRLLIMESYLFYSHFLFSYHQTN